MKKILLTLIFIFTSGSYSSALEGESANAIMKKYKNYIVKPNQNAKCVQYLVVDGERYCSTIPIKELEQPKADSAPERMNFTFDSRKWKKAWWNCNEQFCGIEYILENDDINNWKELVTTNYTNASNVPIDLYYTKFVEGNSIYQPKDKIKYTVIKKSTNDIIFEFQITNAANIQDEVHRAISKGDGLYVIRYTIKKSNMGDDLRAKWTKIISNATVKN